MRKPTSSLCLLLLCLGAQAQRTTHIPGDAPTIQSAIDGANAGDTLVVAPGVYSENLDLRGKGITLRSAEGPAVTVIDGRRLGPVVTFARGESRTTMVAGFTLRNGAPVSATSHGGGVLLVGSAPVLTGNVITGNLCSAVDGTDSAALLTRNTITRTESSELFAAQPVAAVVFTGGSPVLEGNVIERNDLADALSSGVAFVRTRGMLRSNIVRSNRTLGDAPSALLLDGDAIVEQNLVDANASRCGPAVAVSGGRVAVLGNTIADNLTDASCPQESGAAELAVAGTGPMLIVNNILASSTAHPALHCSGPLDLSHNLLHNTAGAVLGSGCAVSALVADPLFTDRAQGDYHLSPQSAALDQGSAAGVALPARDLDDAPRTQSGRVDLGVYEHAVPRSLAASTTSLNATPNPAEAFEAITLTAQVTSANIVPSGSVVFSANSQTLATVPLDGAGRATFTTTTLAVGSASLTAAYLGSDSLAPSAFTLTERIAPATALLSFAVTPSTADDTQTVTLSATVVAPLSTQVPSGQVRFLALNPATTLATVTLDARGQASATLPAMPSGTWLIDAAYLGTPNFSAVTLPATDALTLSIAPRGYTLTSASTTVTVQSGHHMAVALTLRSLGSFASALTLSCSGLPANATCAFSPASPSLTAGATVPVTLTLDTDAVPGFLSLARPNFGPTLAGLPLLACAALLGFRRRRRMGALVCLLAGLTGCTSKYPAQVPSGTYTLQIVSQPAGSGTPQSLPLTLVVTD